MRRKRRADRCFSFNTVEVMQLSMFAGVMGAALLSAIFLIRERARTAAENVALRGRVADLNAAIQRSEALLNLRDQRVIVWNNDRKKPELIGTLPAESGAPDERASFLAFGRWLMPRSAAALEHAVAALRERGIAFDLVIEAQSGAPLEVQGRKSAAHIIVRFLSLSREPALAGAAEARQSAARRQPRDDARPDRRAGHAVLDQDQGRPAQMGEPGLCHGRRGVRRGSGGARSKGTARHAGARSHRQAACGETGLQSVVVDCDRRRPPRLRGDRFRWQ